MDFKKTVTISFDSQGPNTIGPDSMNNWVTFHRRLSHFSLSYSENSNKTLDWNEVKNAFYERG